MEGTRNDLVLLLLGERVEVHGIAGNADGQLRILLGVSLSVEQRLTIEDVDVQVVATLLGVSVEHVDQVIGLSLGNFRNLHNVSPSIDRRRPKPAR